MFTQKADKKVANLFYSKLVLDKAVHSDPVYIATVLLLDVHVFFSASTETWLPGMSS